MQKIITKENLTPSAPHRVRIDNNMKLEKLKKDHLNKFYSN